MMVEEIAGKLFSAELLSELTDDEVAFLILACHFHDLGMSGTEYDNVTESRREQVRKEHAVSVGSRIREQWRSFGFSNEIEARTLGDICRGHRTTKIDGVATWQDLDEVSIIGPDRTVRLRLIAAMIYAADELHLGEDRAPQREEEFGEIRSLESLRHWRRHQSIAGPADVSGKIQFDVNVKTVASELDLRSAIKKAVDALNDLQTQLNKSQIISLIPDVSLNFKRVDLWKLLAIQILADLQPMQRSEIEDAAIGQFLSAMGEAPDPSMCNAELNDATLRREIRRVLDDLQTLGALKNTETSKVALIVEPKIGERVFDLAKEADAFDAVFDDGSQDGHEYSLYQSEFGRTFKKDCLFPHWEQKFQFPFAEAETSAALKTVLQYSPTAARIAEQLSPPPSAMAHTDLLEFAAIAAVCADLINDPELILETDARHAIDTLFSHASKRLPQFLLFAKELAVINKLDFDEISEIVTRSGKIDIPEGARPVELSVSQQFPSKRMHWSLVNVWLACLRANIQITVRNSQLAPFTITEKRSEETADSTSIPTDTPASISFGPGEPSIVPAVSLRLGIDYRDTERTMRVFGGKLSAKDDGRCLSVNISTRETGVQTSTCEMLHSEMTVGDLSAIEKQAEDSSISLVFDIDGLPEVQNWNFGVNEGNHSYKEAIRNIASVDSSLPIPAFVKHELIEQIGAGSTDDIRQKLDEFSREHGSSRFTATVITIRMARIDGADYYEDHLGFMPLNFGFNCPTVAGTDESQRLLESAWNEGKQELLLSCYFKTSADELARLLREWSENTDSEFPLSFSGDNSKFHFANTRMDIVFHPVRDRFWHLQRDVTFRFRPVSRAQRYGIEKEYWRSERKDARRASMLEEMFQQAADEEEKAGLNTVHRADRMLEPPDKESN